MVPYIKGLSKSYKKHLQQTWHSDTLKRTTIRDLLVNPKYIHLRGGRTIRYLLVNPKYIDTILEKSGVIYRYKCGRMDCEDEYIGESGRAFAERFKEDIKPPHPSMTNIRPKVLLYPLITSALWGGRTRALPDQRSHSYQSQYSIPKQKYRQIPSATYMGWGAGEFTRAQA